MHDRLYRSARLRAICWALITMASMYAVADIGLWKGQTRSDEILIDLMITSLFVAFTFGEPPWLVRTGLPSAFKEVPTDEMLNVGGELGVATYRRAPLVWRVDHSSTNVAVLPRLENGRDVMIVTTGLTEALSRDELEAMCAAQYATVSDPWCSRMRRLGALLQIARVVLLVIGVALLDIPLCALAGIALAGGNRIAWYGNVLIDATCVRTMRNPAALTRALRKVACANDRPLPMSIRLLAPFASLYWALPVTPRRDGIKEKFFRFGDKYRRTSEQEIDICLLMRAEVVERNMQGALDVRSWRRVQQMLDFAGEAALSDAGTPVGDWVVGPEGVRSHHARTHESTPEPSAKFSWTQSASVIPPAVIAIVTTIACAFGGLSILQALTGSGMTEKGANDSPAPWVALHVVFNIILPILGVWLFDVLVRYFRRSLPDRAVTRGRLNRAVYMYILLGPLGYVVDQELIRKGDDLSALTGLMPTFTFIAALCLFKKRRHPFSVFRVSTLVLISNIVALTSLFVPSVRSSFDETSTASTARTTTLTAVGSPPLQIHLSQPMFTGKGKGPWFSYDMTIENIGDHEVIVEDNDLTLHGGLIQGTQLFVADSNCGPESAGHGSLPTISCAATTNTRSTAVLAPHTSAKFTTVDVYKGLDGMPALTNGDYSWDRTLTWHYDGSQDMQISTVYVIHHVEGQRR
jgi:hypothetical protein